MMGTVERGRRRRLHPDPRLIVTRTARLAYHLAHRYAHTHLFEWLDPSIPLMFLFAGSAPEEGGRGGQGGVSDFIVGVPR